ncbi:hypothetical protein NX059_011108 [Plenodomus lindquistii]|nr:hypothetical protein NX059_011108 [Plenodomus lindquistii]
MSMYSSLKQGDVRLLHIHSFEDTANGLQVSLEHVPISAAQSGSYATLSYTWGSMEAVVPILVDGGILHIRPNLAEILQILQGLQVKYFWIDAICVNQADVVERSAQVNRMRAIHAGAQRVLIAANAAITGKCDELVPLLNLIEPTRGPAKQKAQVTDLMKAMTDKSALFTLCNDPYWSRLWIIQEFAVGSQAEMLFGSKVIDASKVRWLLYEMGKEMARHHQDRMHNLYSIRRAWQSNRPPQLIDLLDKASGSQCSVRHDRVFGLVGLSPDAVRYLPEPNYEDDSTMIAMAMTRAYIGKTSMDIILLAPHRKPDPGLPSWSPDLFHLDRFPFEQRSLNIVMRWKVPRSMPPDVRTNAFVRDVWQRPSFWNATEGIATNVTFQGNIMQTSAGRIGVIRSLGRAWSDPIDSGFPTHDPTWRRKTKASHLREEFAMLMMNGDYKRAVDGYCFVQVFLESHGMYDPEHSDGNLQSWIHGNRNFFTGVGTIKECAKSLPPALLLYGPGAHTVWYPGRNDFRLGVFQDLAWMAEDDMRMMYLDAGPKWRAGWAAKGARLHDEVFLIPGCSSPVILRKDNNGRYEMVGDAIVYGAMEGEHWDQLNPDDIDDIKIY